MSLMRRVGLSLALVAAVGALVASVIFTISHVSGPGPIAGAAVPNWGGHGGVMMGGSGMMGRPGGGLGPALLAGDGVPVTSIAAARDRAAYAGAGVGLHPGEVIWFDNGYYVELKDAAGAPATEVIVGPATGAVSIEPGPAMMWNLRYGMYRTGASTPAAVTSQRARQLAEDWLARNMPGRLVQPPDTFPGYYTFETTTSDGTINGMLSVNATTGQVWYHNWHGRFIAKEDS